MTKKRFEVMDYFDGENKPIKAIRDTKTTEIYSMDNELEANSTCEKFNVLHEENEQLKQSNNEAVELILDGIVEMHDGKRDYSETIFNKAIKLLKGAVE